MNPNCPHPTVVCAQSCILERAGNARCVVAGEDIPVDRTPERVEEWLDS